jgi:hypothetical protein
MAAVADTLSALADQVERCVPDDRGCVRLHQATLVALLERAAFEQQRQVAALTTTAGRLAGQLEAD